MKSYSWIQKFGAKYKISQIFKHYDLMGLIKIGAPEDEYEYEAKMLYRLINANATYSLEDYDVEDYELLIKSVFYNSFCVGYAQKDDGTLDDNPIVISKSTKFDQDKVTSMAIAIKLIYDSPMTILYEKILA